MLLNSLLLSLAIIMVMSAFFIGVNKHFKKWWLSILIIVTAGTILTLLTVVLNWCFTQVGITQSAMGSFTSFVLPVLLLGLYSLIRVTTKASLILEALLIPAVTLSSLLAYYGTNNSANVILACCITTVVFIALLTLIAMITWGTGTRAAFSVMLTYIINILVSIYILKIFGFQKWFILSESIHFVSAIIILNGIFFWLSFGMDPQEKDPRKRKSYWINKAWLYGCLGHIALIAFALAQGRLATEDVFLSQDINLAIEGKQQVLIDNEMKDYKDVRAKITDAIDSGNIPEIEKLEKLAEQKQKRIGQLQTSKSRRINKIMTETYRPIIDGYDWCELGIRGMFASGGSGKNGDDTPKLTKTFTGIGYTGGADGKGGIEVLCNNVDVQPGQRVTVIGQAETYDNNGYSYSPSFINKVSGNKCLGMRAENGKEFIVSVY